MELCCSMNRPFVEQLGSIPDILRMRSGSYVFAVCICSKRVFVLVLIARSLRLASLNPLPVRQWSSFVHKEIFALTYI